MNRVAIKSCSVGDLVVMKNNHTILYGWFTKNQDSNFFKNRLLINIHCSRILKINSTASVGISKI